MNARRLAAAALAAACLAGSGCHERRPPGPPGDEREAVAAYKGSVDPGTGKVGRFRLRLWAALPDRLHAEISPPVGGPAVIVDAGGGRLSVTVVRERTAYVGAGSADAIRAVTGVPLSVEDLVRCIVLGIGPEVGGIEIRRRPERGPGLPRDLEILSGETTLRIERREAWAAVALPAGTGTGAPPPGILERPIEQLPELDLARAEPAETEDR